jgi:hypothetical protein
VRIRTWSNPELARKLQLAGVIPQNSLVCEQTNETIVIRQDDELVGSRVMVTEDGATCYILSVTISSNLPSPFPISGYSLDVPWPNSAIQWVMEAKRNSKGRRCYRLPSFDYDFRRAEVLNHRKPTLRRGQRLTGLLLGVSLSPVPPSYAFGQLIPVTLTVTDEFDRSFSQEIQLFVDTSAKLVSKKWRKRPSIMDLIDSPRRVEYQQPSETLTSMRNVNCRHQQEQCSADPSVDAADLYESTGSQAGGTGSRLHPRASVINQHCGRALEEAQ